MQKFDLIQEPRVSYKSWRKPRSKGAPVSPLSQYQIDEYTPPPIPKPPRPPGYIHPLVYVVALLWMVGLGAWTACAICYHYNLFPESVINPIRHTPSYYIFTCTLIFTAIITHVILCCAFPRSSIWLLSVAFCFLYTAITWAAIRGLSGGKPFDCANMKRFPVHVVLQTGKAEACNVYLDNNVLWGLTHENIGDGSYRTYISSEYLVWDPKKHKYVDQGLPWPRQTAVTSVVTSLRP